MDKFVVLLMHFAISINLSQTNDNPEELGEKFQGDMIINDIQRRNLDSSPRNGIISKKYHWIKVDDKVNVNFVFSKEKPIPAENVKLVREAIDRIENKTCIKYVEGESKNFIKIFAGIGCYAHVGKQGGEQLLSLGKGCFKVGTIIHEFLHALGFYHMHSSYDRDNFITIHFENVKEKHKFNFDKYSNRRISHFGSTYDLDSIMHYPSIAFATPGTISIETKDPKDLNRIGQREKLSDSDIKRINNMYDCK